MGGVPSTKVVGKGLESPPNLLPCKYWKHGAKGTSMLCVARIHGIGGMVAWGEEKEDQ